MPDAPYSNREIDSKFDAVHGRFDTQDKTLSRILSNVEYTNGKLKKVILALVAVTFLAIGMGLDKGSLILSILGV